jgi:hypothetical protein
MQRAQFVGQGGLARAQRLEVLLLAAPARGEEGTVQALGRRGRSGRVDAPMIAMAAGASAPTMPARARESGSIAPRP